MQAARGAALSASHPGLTASQPAARVRALIVVVFALLYALDQITKWLAVDRLTGEPDREVIGTLLQLRLVRNPGAAFGTGTEYTWVFAGLACVAGIVVIWLCRRVRSALWAVAFGILLAGILGNFTDRIVRQPGGFRGHVVDFLMLPNWPVFNVADICINVAAGLILLQAVRGIGMDGVRVGRHTALEQAPEQTFGHSDDEDGSR